MELLAKTTKNPNKKSKQNHASERGGLFDSEDKRGWINEGFFWGIDLTWFADLYYVYCKLLFIFLLHVNTCTILTSYLRNIIYNMGTQYYNLYTKVHTWVPNIYDRLFCWSIYHTCINIVYSILKSMLLAVILLISCPCLHTVIFFCSKL